MIFATCGSSPFAFDRMMRALEALPAPELIVQHGPSPPPPSVEAYSFLPFGRMVELMAQADIVVSHAGVGSIMCALEAGHVPVVFPRLKSYSETVDDHQAELASALAERGTVIVATSPQELVNAVKSVPVRSRPSARSASGLSLAVRAAIRGEGSHALRAHRHAA